MRKTLTDRGLKALAAKPPSGRTQPIIWDALLPGFGVRVSGKGKLSYVAVRRLAGSKAPVKFKVGEYPIMPLPEAREAARAALIEMAQGLHPGHERDRRIRERQEVDARTFAGAAKFYLEHVADKRAIVQIRGIVEREFISRWDGRPIASISRREITAMVDEIKKGKDKPGARKVGGPDAARQALAYCRRIFKFAVARSLLDANPADAISGVELIGEKKPRQRVLTDEELRKVLAAFPWDTRDGLEPQDRGRWPIAPMLWLLALLGVRRGELAAATWDKIDPDKAIWIIPPENAKSGDAHVVPLPQMAVRIFASLPRFLGSLIFTTNGVSQVGGWSAFKNEVDFKSGVSDWTIHDLRRTARSNWSALGVEPHVAEMMLGHRQKGIVSVYDVHRFQDERREALEKWSRRIAEIVSPPPEDDKVVKMRRA